MTLAETSSIEAEVAKVLDAFHQAAASSDFEGYFSYFSTTQEARFLGTDVSENWTLDEFRSYAKPHFNSGNGWVYRPLKRKINYLSSSPTAISWFDESLQSEKWGTARGTGVMVLEEKSWKILQYHMSFPTPNELAEDITSMISTHSDERK